MAHEPNYFMVDRNAFSFRNHPKLGPYIFELPRLQSLCKIQTIVSFAELTYVVGYINRRFACEAVGRQSPIQVVTGPDVEQLG